MRLWLNQGFSSVYHALAQIKAGLGDELTVVASHSDPWSLVQAAADEFFVEPNRLDEGAYVSWVRDRCAEHAITHFWPQRRAAAIVRAEDTLGVQLLVAGQAEMLDILADKVSTYRTLSGSEVPVPSHWVARTASELEEAFRLVEGQGERPCIKPAVSTFGHGFRVIAADGDVLGRVLRNDTFLIGRQEFLEMVAASSSKVPFLVMPYLEGPEYSVDCLAKQSRLIRYVARQKQTNSRGQRLLCSPEIGAICAAITERFNLGAVFNVQLRENRGELFLLEVNARMSGGLAIASASGLSFPEWAVRLALGADPGKVPQPSYGGVVAQIESPVKVSP